MRRSKNCNAQRKMFAPLPRELSKTEFLCPYSSFLLSLEQSFQCYLTLHIILTFHFYLQINLLSFCHKELLFLLSVPPSIGEYFSSLVTNPLIPLSSCCCDTRFKAHSSSLITRSRHVPAFAAPCFLRRILFHVSWVCFEISGSLLRRAEYQNHISVPLHLA